MTAAVRLKELEDIEKAERINLQWQREKELTQHHTHMRRVIRHALDRTDDAQRRQELQAEHRVKTIERKLLALVGEEQKKRLNILLSESQTLENILRAASRDIRAEVFLAAQSTQQRIKYFNKTLDVILKKEASGRLSVQKQERYAFLVHQQKADKTLKEIQRREFAEKVREEKRLRHDQVIAQEKERERADEDANCPSRSTTPGDKSDASSQRNADTTTGAGDGTEGEEKTKHLQPVDESEENDASGNESHQTGPSNTETSPSDRRRRRKKRSSSDENTKDAHPKATSDKSSSKAAPASTKSNTTTAKEGKKPTIVNKHAPEFYNQCLTSLIEKEHLKRLFIADDEDVQWNSINHHIDYLIIQDEERQHNFRLQQVDTNRVVSRHMEVVQQEESAERRNIEKSHERGVAALVRKLNRRIFLEVQREEEEAARHSVHNIRVERKVERVTAQRAALSENDKQSYAALASPSSSSSFLPPISQSQPYPYVDSREAALFRSEEQGRLRIEKEQEQRLLNLRVQSRKVVPQDVDGRCSTVRQRRLEQEKDTQAKLMEQQQADNEKAAVFVQMSKVFQSHNQERRKVLQEEHKLRVDLQLEYSEGFGVLEKSYRGATRLQSALDGLIQTEKRERKELVGDEVSRRDALRATFSTWKPAHRKPIAPLPPPPTDFQEAQRVYAEFYKSTCPTKPRKTKEWEKPPPRSRRTISSIPMITTVMAKMSAGATGSHHATKRTEHQPRPPPPAQPQHQAPPRESHGATASAQKPRGASKMAASKSNDETKAENPPEQPKPNSVGSSKHDETSTNKSEQGKKTSEAPDKAADQQPPPSNHIEDDEYGEMSGSSSRNSEHNDRHSASRSRSRTPPSEHYSTDEDHSPTSARRESATA